jgi:hypothetical protein
MCSRKTNNVNLLFAVWFEETPVESLSLASFDKFVRDAICKNVGSYSKLTSFNRKQRKAVVTRVTKKILDLYGGIFVSDKVEIGESDISGMGLYALCSIPCGTEIKDILSIADLNANGVDGLMAMKGSIKEYVIRGLAYWV